MNTTLRFSLVLGLVAASSLAGCSDDGSSGSGFGGTNGFGSGNEGGDAGSGPSTGKFGKGGTSGKGGSAAGSDGDGGEPGDPGEEAGTGGKGGTSSKGGSGGSTSKGGSGGTSSKGGSGGSTSKGGSGGTSSKGGSGGSTSKGGSGGTGGAPDELTCDTAFKDNACGTCAKTQCCTEAEACFADEECVACLQGDSSQCTGTAVTDFEACLNDTCATDCSPPAACTAGGGDFTGATACEDCQDQELASDGCCGAPSSACASNPACTGLFDCFDGCAPNDQACVDACASANEDGVQDYLDLLECVLGPSDGSNPGACGTACDAGSGGSGGAGGASGAGGSGAGAGGTGAGGSGAGAGGTGAGGNAGAAGSGGAPSCTDVFYQDLCGSCVEANCCDETSACIADASCDACIGGDETKCTGPAFTAFLACQDAKCAKECKPTVDCGVTQTKPSNGSCGATYTCNPLAGLNVGGVSKECSAGSTCDASGQDFACFPPPNDIALCGTCNNTSTFCADGLSCQGGKCARFCCDDGDCSATGRCDTAPGQVGTCVTK